MQHYFVTVAEEDQRLWIIELQNETLEKIKIGQLKEARDKKGVVGEPIWSFIEPHNLIFPHLHFPTSSLQDWSCQHGS